MKIYILLILIFSVLSCNSDKNKTELNKLNSNLIGIYEYQTAEKSESHYIIIDTINGKYNGFYYGTEDSGGHGVFFYGNRIEKWNIEKNKISFEIGTRELYENTQMKIVKHKRDLKKDSITGISRGQLKYSGEISENAFKLKCESEFGYCMENELNFEKITK